MAHRYRDGWLVAPPNGPSRLAEAASPAVDAYREAMDAFALRTGVSAAFGLVDAANEYIATVEPWVTAGDPARSAELDRQLYDVSEAVRIAALLLTPLMPSSCREVLARVGTPVEAPLPALDRGGVWTTPPGAERRIAKGDPLWPRLEPDRAAANVDTGAERKEQWTMDDSEQRGASGAAPAAATGAAGSDGAVSAAADTGESAGEAAPAAPEAPRISIDEFAKVELRVGRVVTAEAVRKSKKLLRLEIEDGGGVRVRSSPASRRPTNRRAWWGATSFSWPTCSRRS